MPTQHIFTISYSTSFDINSSHCENAITAPAWHVISSVSTKKDQLLIFSKKKKKKETPSSGKRNLQTEVPIPYVFTLHLKELCLIVYNIDCAICL
jgi:hypothetical protein